MSMAGDTVCTLVPIPSRPAEMHRWTMSLALVAQTIVPIGTLGSQQKSVREVTQSARRWRLGQLQGGVFFSDFRSEEG